MIIIIVIKFILRNPECRKLASSSKDNDVRIWDTVLCQTILTLAGHTKPVSVVKWGGSGVIYTASQDRTIRVWRADDGILCRILEGHAHWVNTLALNTDFVLRTGPFHPVMDSFSQQINDSKLNDLRKCYQLMFIECVFFRKCVAKDGAGTLRCSKI